MPQPLPRDPVLPSPPRKRRLKNWLLTALGKFAGSRSPRALPDWTARQHRVLFLRNDRIGDMVLATATIKAIASAHPTITVDVLASVLNAAVLRGNPHVGTVISIDKKRPWSYLATIARIRRARYDAIVDPLVMSQSLTTTLLMLCSGAEHRIGLAGRGNDSVLTVPVAPVAGAVHYVDRVAAVLTAFGVPVSVSQPELFLTAAESSTGEARWRSAEIFAARQAPGRRLVVNVSATKRNRYWADKRFIETLLHLRRCYPDVVILIIGSPADWDRMSRIGVGAGVAVVRTPHYREMMAIVAASHFVFTADTSVTHIASAFRKPVVVMYPGRGGGLWGPYGTRGTILSAAPSLEALEVAPVIRALQEMIMPPAEREPGSLTAA
jgi:heptosyltransferase II